jgi:folate-dependent phosphoribosylglycinamide formyltransferase PurN
MKIVFFTSSIPGKVNQLNLLPLIEAHPDFEFVFVVVDNKFKYYRNTVKNYIKECVFLTLGRRNDWYADKRAIEKRISKLVNPNFGKGLKKIFVKDVNGLETEAVIRGLQPDLMIQCGAGILKENIFSIPKMGTLNVHHGIAPEVRGVSSTFWSMYYGLHECIGVTVHFIDKTLDTGVVILQKSTKLPETFDYIEAVYQTCIQGAPMLALAVDIIIGDYTVKRNDVKSYYFSSVKPKKYLELKDHNFRPVKTLDEIKYKTKPKNQVFTITSNSIK